MEQTGNYSLNQWEGQDRILREDFNADNAKVEAALAQEASARTALQSSINAAMSALETKLTNNSLKVKTGTVAGTGGYGVRTVDLGVRPKLLILWNNNTATSTYVSGAIVTDFVCMDFRSSGSVYLEAAGNPCGLTDSGFTIAAPGNPNLALNAAGTSLYYWCLY